MSYGRLVDKGRAKKSLRALAHALGRDPATISREVRRNRDPRTRSPNPRAEQPNGVLLAEVLQSASSSEQSHGFCPRSGAEPGRN
ncbi:helix-turn-helix domain-containing protein [Streptomyces mirabilis]